MLEHKSTVKMQFITNLVFISLVTLAVAKGESDSSCNATSYVEHNIRTPVLLSCDNSDLKAEISSLEAELKQEIQEQIRALKDTIIIPIGSSPYRPASNCSEIFHLPGPPATTGIYWLSNPKQDNAVQVKCDFDLQLPPPSPVKGWQEIVNIDLSNPTNSCPSPLREVTSPSRRCERTIDNGGCESVFFTTNGVPFSRLCGRSLGYGIRSPDAFLRFCDSASCDTIDEPYVDGISITYTSGLTRQHIWSLAAHHHGMARCPCGNTRDTTPSFVGNNYYCESAVDNNSPLWEGEGCTDVPAASTGGNAPCCENPNFPWFCREFDQPIVTGSIEVRLCTDEPQSNEDVEFDLLKLYIQ